MLAILAVLVFFMFRNSRKRKQQQEELQAQIQPGAEIMTNFGLFGTLKSIDEISNVAEVETSPGIVVRVHRQTIARVINDDEPRSVEEAAARAAAELEEREKAAKVELNQDHAIPVGEPEFGERIEPEVKKPARRAPAKKTDK
jgi:preprotein translocase subunit YajC